MRCWYLALTLLIGPLAHAEEQFCRNGFFPLKVGLLRSARVVGSPAQHIPLEGDAFGVPGATWMWGSVSGGATVLVDPSGSAEHCVLTFAPEIDRFGFVPANLLRLVPRQAPRPREWIGTYRAFDDEIEIGRSTKPGQLRVDFAGPLAEGGAYTIGESSPSGDTLRIE